MHYGFDLEQPFEELPPRVQEILLYGSGTEPVGFKYLGERGGFQTRTHPFEGILRNLERRYHETDSLTVREELANTSTIRPAPAARARDCARRPVMSRLLTTRFMKSAICP